MGLCKCQKRKVTNLFCFEHDVNVCEYCLVADHERCIVQSYVQWLQDSDYNPICILCKNLLKDEPTVRLICYDVFHWSCLDKYACQLPANTAPAGYQCPKCKECIFPPQNLVSPVVEALKSKLDTASWSRIGLDQSLLPVDDSLSASDVIKEIISDTNTQQSNLTTASTATDDESNGFVIVNGKSTQQQKLDTTIPGANKSSDLSKTETIKPSNKAQVNKATKNVKNIEKTDKQVRVDLPKPDEQHTTHSHNRGMSTQTGYADEQYYDSSLGVVLNVDNLDRDTGEYKYQRRPLFEWLARWLKSRQISNKFRMTRQKKTLFIIIFIFISLFTLIIIFSRLGSITTENDPALDPMNNPNIRVQ